MFTESDIKVVEIDERRRKVIFPFPNGLVTLYLIKIGDDWVNDVETNKLDKTILEGDDKQQGH